MVALVPAVIAGGAGYVVGRLAPDHPAAAVVPAPGTIVARTMEAKANSADNWQAIEPKATATVTAVDVEKSAAAVAAAGTNFSVSVRYRLTIRDVATSNQYDVQVRATCFDALSVGGPWPSGIDACR